MKLLHYIHKHKCINNCSHPKLNKLIENVFRNYPNHIFFISSHRDLKDEFISFKKLNNVSMKFNAQEVYYKIEKNKRKFFKYGIEPLFVYSNDYIMKKLYPSLISDCVFDRSLNVNQENETFPLITNYKESLVSNYKEPLISKNKNVKNEAHYINIIQNMKNSYDHAMKLSDSESNFNNIFKNF